MTSLTAPWDTLADRRKLYDWQELYGRNIKTFDHRNTFEYRVYHAFLRSELNPTWEEFRARSLHDSGVGFDLLATITQLNKPVVAIMGGHKLARNSEAYRTIVELTRTLTFEGFLVTSGGGPGAMEAAHFGALTANTPEQQVNDWLDRLAATPAFPPEATHLGEWLIEHPERHGEDIDRVLSALSAWLHPALLIRQELENSHWQAGQSLSIPTWHYGHEPPTPFATHIARLFQNSIREDSLLAYAKNGVIFFEGSAGTVQEVFQDNTQNYYKSFKQASPMIFFATPGNELYWQAPPEVQGAKVIHRRPVKPLLDALYLSASAADVAMYERYTRYVTSIEEVMEVIREYHSAAAG